MDCSKTENYLKERARMGKVDELGNCSINCIECPLSPQHNKEGGCGVLEHHYPDKAVAIVQKWSDEHPQKTYKDDFFEKFPKAMKDKDGTPKYCLKRLYGLEKECNKLSDCYKCWNEVMPE